MIRTGSFCGVFVECRLHSDLLSSTIMKNALGFSTAQPVLLFNQKNDLILQLQKHSRETGALWVSITAQQASLGGRLCRSLD